MNTNNTQSIKSKLTKPIKFLELSGLLNFSFNLPQKTPKQGLIILKMNQSPNNDSFNKLKSFAENNPVIDVIFPLPNKATTTLEMSLLCKPSGSDYKDEHGRPLSTQFNSVCLLESSIANDDSKVADAMSALLG